jgi:flagellar biosynthesis GTPase FlhF
MQAVASACGRSSLFARLHVKEQNEGTHVPLSTIFDSRKELDDHEKQPRRILIRGQAGVGKTTLCKKMVYDFTYTCTMWQRAEDFRM